MSASVVEVPAYRSEEWVAGRNRGLGASDLAAVAGQSPWQGEHALALLKRGLVEPQGDTVATRWGQRIESLALDAYEEMTGVQLIRGETWRDERWPHLWATLDGRAGRIGVEVKATTRWRDEPPPHVRVQALGQMGIADLEAVDVVRVSPYMEPHVVRVERDEDAIRDLLDLAEAWYVKYVEGDELPPPDGSPASMRYLDTLRGEAAAQATVEQADLMAKLRAVRVQSKRLEEQDRQLVAALKASMAGTGSLVGTGWRIAWSAVRGRTTTDWKAVAESLRPLVRPGEWDERVASVTSVAPDGTRFVPTWTEEGDDDGSGSSS